MAHKCNRQTFMVNKPIGIISVQKGLMEGELLFLIGYLHMACLQSNETRPYHLEDNVLFTNA